ncbi:helix-turn-helix domain-containing protein [Pyrobaculum aerophilum]|uniref:Uncharacterized protein n=1 Tax=Pyrobaculum aerophilum TaxID=13773 RepID=A0A371QZR3_9CREN|nr:helix-turn-helix domain-containing protein [Pyrobaculum aerophilum]RFA92332.1 hypothetical protein CGL51_14615 [Pyrobaculum aerophilum]RFA96203.1 hypothetical protein CGL52_11285 [Pyrobaculum aerophilum]
MPKVKCNCKEAARRLVSLGLSYSEVSKILGVSEKTVKKWIGGAQGAFQTPRQQKPAETRTVEPAAGTEAWRTVNAPVFQNEWVRLLREKGGR